VGELSRRERSLAIAFYAATSLATVLWWACLVLYPESRALFLGRDFGERWLWIMLAPDLLSALVMSTAMVWALNRSHRVSMILAWVHFGAQGYAWAISVGLAIIDPNAYWGVVAMTLSTGVSLAFAIRLQEIDILWGAFRFQFAAPGSPKNYWRQSLLQTAGMWGVFLGLLPLVFVLVEKAFRWDASWLAGTWRLPVAGAAFLLASSVGLWAGWVMTQRGDGTPLPSAGTRKLVIEGPYRFIRNPMACCGITQGISVGLAIGSPLIMVYALVGGVWWEVLVRNLEEAHLSKLFGEEFQRYVAEVSCWRVRFRKN
jgi:protein-S-isoprenylcysteine O-methyltransferase Ste14